MDEEKDIINETSEEEKIDYIGGVDVEDRANYIDPITLGKIESNEYGLNFRVWDDNKKAHTYFEKVSRFANDDLITPMRKTFFSAGYDMAAAEDIVVPSYQRLMSALNAAGRESIYNLQDLASITKEFKLKPTLIPTGYKCRINGNQFIQLSIRSSSPLKYWLVLANGVGIIDSDYYNNPDNEGEIFFQVINLSPFDIKINKGDIIGQAIVMNYNTLDIDVSGGLRSGGFGSTTEVK
jgi:dUTP pyrophosphatase